MMTTKPKTRKAPAPAVDPVFAAIAEHKALIKESNRLEAALRSARAKAEKEHGEWTMAPRSGEWPGEAIVSPFYDRWNRSLRAERKMAIRVARTIPATNAGIEALIHHAHQAIVTDRDAREVDWRDWIPTVLKTVSRALAGAA